MTMVWSCNMCPAHGKGDTVRVHTARRHPEEYDWIAKSNGWPSLEVTLREVTR